MMDSDVYRAFKAYFGQEQYTEEDRERLKRAALEREEAIEKEHEGAHE